jgi:hypothetical protein
MLGWDSSRDSLPDNQWGNVLNHISSPCSSVNHPANQHSQWADSWYSAPDALCFTPDLQNASNYAYLDTRR